MWGAATNYTGNLGLGGSPVPTLYLINGEATKRGTPEQKAGDLIFSIGLTKARTFADDMLRDAQSGLEWTLDKGLGYYERIAALTHGIQRRSEVKRAPGLIYQVQIPVSPVLLSWDVPMASQSGHVLAALKQEQAVDLALSGREYYRQLAARLGSARAASERLLALGVRGIRYLDEYSRSCGQGSENYVIFSDRDVSVVARLGQQRAAAPAVPRDPPRLARRRP